MQVIVNCATHVGVDGKSLEEFLHNETAKPTKQEIIEMGKHNDSHYKVPSIPYFIVNEEHMFSAESPATFTNLF